MANKRGNLEKRDEVLKRAKQPTDLNFRFSFFLLFLFWKRRRKMMNWFPKTFLQLREKKENILCRRFPWFQAGAFERNKKRRRTERKIRVWLVRISKKKARRRYTYYTYLACMQISNSFQTAPARFEYSPKSKRTRIIFSVNPEAAGKKARNGK